MSKTDPAKTPGAAPSELKPAEASLAHALVLLQRALVRLDEPARASEVQAALQSAGALVEAARTAHAEEFAPRPAAAGAHRVPSTIAPEIAAVIAAAVSVTFERPHRVVSVQPVPASVPYLNVWALEGRTEIFHSHRIR